MTSMRKKIAWLITTFLFSSFIIFETYSWSKYSFLICSFILICLSIDSSYMVDIHIGVFHAFTLAFAAYIAISALWSLDIETTILMSRTIIRILICVTMFVSYYDKSDSIGNILNSIKWAGFVIALYTIKYYGLTALINASQAADNHLGNSFSNLNTISQLGAVACLIQYNEYKIKKKIGLCWIMLIPTLFVIVASQSRKGLLLLLCGILGMYILESIDKKHPSQAINRLIIGLFICLGVYYLIVEMRILGGLSERIVQSIKALTGEKKGIDSSTVVRMEMMNIGMSWWKENPISGIGIGAPHILVQMYLGRDAYMHNNYVELLCGGGIIGLGLYYFIYIYILVNMIRYRKSDREYGNFMLVWIITMIVIDFAKVSYYTKSQWFYLATFYIQIIIMRRREKRINGKQNSKSKPIYIRQQLSI